MNGYGHSLIQIKHKGNNNTKPTKAGKQMVDDRLGEVQDRKKSQACQAYTQRYCLTVRVRDTPLTSAVLLVLVTDLLTFHSKLGHIDYYREVVGHSR